jgi:hypothetical protein
MASNGSVMRYLWQVWTKYDIAKAHIRSPWLDDNVRLGMFVYKMRGDAHVAMRGMTFQVGGRQSNEIAFGIIMIQ